MFYISCLYFSSCTPPASNFEEPFIQTDQFVLQDSFQIQVIASEPLVETPVAMDFDEKGRIWVVEMRGYMPNINGTEENAPNGRILILEDKDQDGRMDHHKIFLDSLVLPRALALVYGGVLYAEPPNLWWVSRMEDQVGKRILVDSTYAIGGNVEHQPNGLHWNIDNWIYSAKSNARYRRINGKWIKEPTAFRGQWGITHDDVGRLFFNDNSNHIYADFTLPNLLERNPFGSKRPQGISEWIEPDQRIYPLQATAVNRGYLPDILDEHGKLKKFTSACGPIIYRGDNFPQEYWGNAFVCAPEANLIKRDWIQEENLRLKAKQVWENKEFLASWDEGFRPVNLYNAPDGTLYILDFHRGVIQHKAYMTAYLYEKLLEKQLDTIVGMGRILRLQFGNQPLSSMPDFSKLKATQITKFLTHPNGFWRDKAQQSLVEKEGKGCLEALEIMALDNSNYLAQLHALWTLEGTNQLTLSLLQKLASSTNSKINSTITFLLTDFFQKKNLPNLSSTLAILLEKKEEETDLYLTAILGNFASLDPIFAFEQLHQVLLRHSGDPLFFDAAISGLAEREALFLAYLKLQPEDTTLPELQKKLATLLAKKQKATAPSNFFAPLGKDDKTIGLQLYQTHCMSCHGADGAGIPHLAPPLLNSEYVTDSIRLGLVVLHGLAGPIHINSKRYEFQTAMPGVKENPDLSDQDIADLLSFVRNAFSHTPRNVPKEAIAKWREVEVPEGGLWTEEKLKIWNLAQ